MKVTEAPSGDKLRASSDFDEKLVTKLMPALAASWVTFTVLLTAPVLEFTLCRMMLPVMPKFASAVSLFHTLLEQLLFEQKTLPVVAFSEIGRASCRER